MENRKCNKVKNACQSKMNPLTKSKVNQRYFCTIIDETYWKNKDMNKIRNQKPTIAQLEEETFGHQPKHKKKRNQEKILHDLPRSLNKA